MSELVFWILLIFSRSTVVTFTFDKRGMSKIFDKILLKASIGDVEIEVKLLVTSSPHSGFRLRKN